MCNTKMKHVKSVLKTAIKVNIESKSNIKLIITLR